MICYDPKVIQEFAQTRYKQANRFILVARLIGFVLGGGAGVFLGSLVPAASPPIVMAGVGLVLAIPGAFMGNLLGSIHAMSLRLDAQTALCQVEIEANTRGSGGRPFSGETEA